MFLYILVIIYREGKLDELEVILQFLEQMRQNGAQITSVGIALQQDACGKKLPCNRREGNGSGT